MDWKWKQKWKEFEWPFLGQLFFGKPKRDVHGGHGGGHGGGGGGYGGGQRVVRIRR